MMLTAIPPAEARALIGGGARLVDIREADEHARLSIPGAQHRPLGAIDGLNGEGPVVFHCRSGMRTAANAAALTKAAAGNDCYFIEGGIDAWRRAGFAVTEDKRQPIEIMRQVQIAAGSLIVIGLLLGFLVAPGFFALSGFVGCGLVFAGATGWCGMARLLALMPWNRRLAA